MDQIRRTTLMDSVTEELRNAIMNGEVKLGERVNENTFNLQAGNHRTTFGKQLRQLEQAACCAEIHFGYVCARIQSGRNQGPQ